MERQILRLTALVVLTAFPLTACATFPREGPSRPALIGTGKSHAQYESDDAYCRQLARERTGVSPGEAMERAQIGSTILGTVLGAGLGAGLGGAIGGGRGAGIGAAAGGLSGAAGGVGAGTAMGGASATAVQQRYDGEYYACMYARGHQVPGLAPVAHPGPQQPAYVPPPPPPSAVPASAAPPPAPVGAQSETRGAQSVTTGPPSQTACKPTGRQVKTAQGLVPECE